MKIARLALLAVVTQAAEEERNEGETATAVTEASTEAPTGHQQRTVPSNPLFWTPFEWMPGFNQWVNPLLPRSPAATENMNLLHSRINEGIVALSAWPNLAARNVDPALRAFSAAMEGSGFPFPPLIRGFQALDPTPEDMSNNPLLAWFRTLPDIPTLGPFNPATMDLDQVQQVLEPFMQMIPRDQTIAIPNIGKVTFTDTPINYQVTIPPSLDWPWAGPLNPKTLIPPNTVLPLMVKIEPLEGDPGFFSTILVPSDGGGAGPAAAVTDTLKDIPGTEAVADATASVPGVADAGEEIGELRRLKENMAGEDVFTRYGPTSLLQNLVAKPVAAAFSLEEVQDSPPILLFPGHPFVAANNMLSGAAYPAQGVIDLLPRPNVALQPLFDFVRSPFGSEATTPPVLNRARGLFNQFLQTS